ncbi:MAG: nucleotidyltransferase domain-containing protein [Deltaproteobacteria bacterium]|nr:nucleotidyltransferase domain-containing protein [Deltaproteobacteria bacterium]
MAARAIPDTEQVIRTFVRRLNRVFPLEAVFLYGSHARGWQDAWSDIDLAVVSRRFDRASRATWEAVRRIAHAISPILDARPFGAREFARYERGDFVHEIHRTGKQIYRNGRFAVAGARGY